MYCFLRAMLVVARISYGNSVCLSVRPTVCPGVMSGYRSKPRWGRYFGFSPYDSLESVVFRDKISCP